MSTLTPGSVVCHKCGTRFDAQLWTGLHATTAVGMRQEVLDDVFHRFECPGCGYVLRVEPTMLYTDFERWQWIAVLPEAAIRHRRAIERKVEDGFRDNMVIHCPPMVREWAPRFTRRVAFGLSSLRDKLIAFDAGLDDRILEVLKLQIIRDQGELRADVRLWLDGVAGGELVFLRVVAEPGVGMEHVTRFSVPRAAYDALVGREFVMPEIFEGIVVDWRAPMMPDLPLEGAA